MEYAILALCIINLGILVYLLFRKNKIEVVAQKDDSLLEKQIAGNTELKLKIEEILKDLKTVTKQIMDEQILSLRKEFNDQNLDNRKGLEEFKNTLQKKCYIPFAAAPYLAKFMNILYETPLVTGEVKNG